MPLLQKLIICKLFRYELLFYQKPFCIIVKLLALALTNLVFDLVNLVTNLAKPSQGQPIC